jgi:hypothetical protein
MRPVRILRPCAVAGVAITLAACGSTVQMGSNAAVGTTAQGGLSAPTGAPGQPGVVGGSAPAGTLTGGGTTGPGGTTGQPGTTGAGTTSSGATTGATKTTSGSGIVANAPGITSTTVYMGVKYSSQSGSADRAIGASGAAPSYDFRNVMNAVIDYANAHGGFAGRKLKALYYDYNLSDPQDSQDQSACAYWTQDNKTFALPAEASNIMRACAEKAGGVSFGAGGAVASTYQKSPHYIDVNSVRLDRLGPMTTNGLYRAGYFSGKLGFVTWDDPNYRFAYTHGYVPTLKSHGISVTDAAFVKVPQTLDAVGEMSATMSSIVTKFRTDGIDHVIIQDGHAGVWAGTGLTLEFMDQAESQKYYPRYGQNAQNSPGWSGLPSDQMDKALAILDSDYEPKDDAGWHTNRQRELCWKIEKDAGYPISPSNVNDEGLAAQACDQVFFLQTNINRLKLITSDTFMQSVNGLGRIFPSALVYGTQFAAGLHDGSAAVRQAEYSAGCKCLIYHGSPYYP